MVVSSGIEQQGYGYGYGTLSNCFSPRLPLELQEQSAMIDLAETMGCLIPRCPGITYKAALPWSLDHLSVANYTAVAIIVIAITITKPLDTNNLRRHRLSITAVARHTQDSSSQSSLQFLPSYQCVRPLDSLGNRGRLFVQQQRGILEAPSVTFLVSVHRGTLVTNVSTPRMPSEPQASFQRLRFPSGVRVFVTSLSWYEVEPLLTDSVQAVSLSSPVGHFSYKRPPVRRAIEVLSSPTIPASDLSRPLISSSGGRWHLPIATSSPPPSYPRVQPRRKKKRAQRRTPKNVQHGIRTQALQERK